MRRFDKNLNIQKVNLLAEQRYLESKELLKEELMNLIKEEQFTDLFKFIAQDPKKMTQGSAYYVADLNSSMNKNIVDDDGNKIPNPMYGKLYKHTRFLFKWEDTYLKAMDRVDPEHIAGKRSGNYEKVQGYDVLETGKSGLYLPIIPTGSEYHYVVDNNGNMEVIDKETVKKYLRPISPSTVSAIEAGKPQFRPLIIDKVAKISGGGNVWKNPNFKGVYMGPGSTTN